MTDIENPGCEDDTPYSTLILSFSGVAGMTDRHCKNRVILLTLIVLLLVFTEIT